MRVIYVDDEAPAIQNFRFTVANFPEIRQLHTFQNGEEALSFARENTIDAAFLDMEMPGIHGLQLARALKEHDPNIRVVFVTAFAQYALDAFGVDATGYLLKPYSAADIHKELAKCAYTHLPSHRLVLRTIPTFSATVDGAPLSITGPKSREMLALLVDRAESGLSVGEAIACLWPDRPADAATQSLCRMAFKRLAEALERVDLSDVVYTIDSRRYLRTDSVDCDLYRILAGDRLAARRYVGEYLSEYEWAEDRNAQLYFMLLGENQ